MKTIEEKAKAYDEAAKIIKANLGALNDITEMGEKVVNIQSIKNCFYRAFPELRDNEDERIRKEMIGILRKEARDFPSSVIAEKSNSWIAWLEKQGEQKPIWHNEYEEPRKDSLILLIMQSGTPIVAKIIEPNHLFNHGERWAYIEDLLEGQSEQKPIMIQWTGDNLKELVHFTGKSPKFDEWFKTWEDFEDYVHTHNNIFKIFNDDGSHYEVPVGAWIIKTPDGYNVASRCVFKPKSAEWSEEDNKRLQRIIDFLWHNRKGDTDTIYQQEQDIEWLKSLMPQKQWKPTPEQMKHLVACIEESGGNLVLDSLYEQLKQLYYGTSRTN